MRDQRDYWDDVADETSFSHPVNRVWLRRWLPSEARILDFGCGCGCGCGYGRVTSAVAALGYKNVVGVDFSRRMIERGLRRHPQLDLRLLAGLPMDECNAAYDAAVLFAVLTCVPDDEGQRDIMNEIQRLVRPGGLLYLSDMPLQSDDRNRRRYAEAQGRFGTYGVFETEDGAVMRHFDESRLNDLLAGFQQLIVERVRVSTMNGHAATAVQIIARKQ